MLRAFDGSKERYMDLAEELVVQLNGMLRAWTTRRLAKNNEYSQTCETITLPNCPVLATTIDGNTLTNR